MQSQLCRSCPIGSPEDGDQSPRIVEKCAGEQGEEIQLERPGAETHHHHMQAIRRGKADEDADRKGQGRAVGRFVQMKNSTEERPNVSHRRSGPGIRAIA